MRKFVTIFFLLASAFSRAQDTSFFKLTGKLEGTYTDFNVDNLGNYYLLSKNNQLKKLSSKGDSVGVFNDVRRYGKLYSMDVTNPLKCLLYYRNFSTVVVLDRFLNTVNTIDLRKQNIFQVKAIAQSYDNKIWLYDEQNNKLKKIGDDGVVLMETPDLRTIFNEVPSPVSLTDQDGYVYLYDPEKGLYVFDIYGSFKTKVSYTGLTDVTVIGKTFAGRRNGSLLTYTIGTLTERTFPLPAVVEQQNKCVFLPGHLYVLQPGGVLHFTI